MQGRQDISGFTRMKQNMLQFHLFEYVLHFPTSKCNICFFIFEYYVILITSNFSKPIYTTFYNLGHKQGKIQKSIKVHYSYC